jgi:methylase of polypeptide subunit release factors
LNSISLSEERGYKIEKNVVITANLPYIKDNDYTNIDKETIEFEPALALY